MDILLSRNVAPKILDLLGAFRVVLLGGARQAGKTTLVRDLLDLPPQSLFSFDDQAVLERAVEDPRGFVEALPQPAVVDEFQRAGQSFLLAVKQAADRNRTRGQLLLTGSANYLADRSLSETLAGRAGRVLLWPLSVGERKGIRETFLDRLFEPTAWPVPVEELARSELVALILQGGYPEIVLTGLNARQRRNWFEAYVQDVVSREALRPLADVRLEAELRRVLRLLATHAGQELVVSSLADEAELNRETTSNYITLLEALHLVTLIPAWSTNATKRVTHRPKIMPIDIGLAADVCGYGEQMFSPTMGGTAAGALFESFVAIEIHKQLAWSERTLDIFHYRDRNQAEVDLIVEDRRTGEIAGIEIKLTQTPTQRHARHLAMLRDRLAGRFKQGFVIHAGEHTLPLGERLWAVPVTALWRSN